jgi:uncharacterized RDD family membrane protein YckC/Tfp pilus assembly protein PilE
VSRFVTATLQPLPTHYQDHGMYAGFWRRALAWFIDAMLIGLVEWVALMTLGSWLVMPWTGHAHGTFATTRFFDGLLLPFVIVIGWLYFALCESSNWQATPGKLALGLAVTDEYGASIGFARATGRHFGKCISALILGIGFLLAGWTKRKQALHDLMAGCCVVRKSGLLARQNRETTEPESTATLPHSGMPGWGIALVVIGAGMFLVLPVAAILAAIAIPAYQSYVVRSEVAQGIDLTARTRSLVAEYIGQRGALPDGNGALGLPKPEAIQARYVSSVRVTGGKVVVTYGNQANPWINGGHLVIAPIGDAAALHWQCSSPDIRARYLPSACRDRGGGVSAE